MGSMRQRAGGACWIWPRPTSSRCFATISRFRASAASSGGDRPLGGSPRLEATSPTGTRQPKGTASLAAAVCRKRAMAERFGKRLVPWRQPAACRPAPAGDNVASVFRQWRGGELGFGWDRALRSTDGKNGGKGNAASFQHAMGGLCAVALPAGVAAATRPGAGPRRDEVYGARRQQ